MQSMDMYYLFEVQEFYYCPIRCFQQRTSHHVPYTLNIVHDQCTEFAVPCSLLVLLALDKKRGGGKDVKDPAKSAECLEKRRRIRAVSGYNMFTKEFYLQGLS